MEWQDGVQFTAPASVVLAGKVAAAIEAALARRKPSTVPSSG